MNMITARRVELVIGLVRLTAIACALLLVTVLAVNRSRAAFTATTANGVNAFSTGTVVLTDDDTGTAMFSVSNMTPGTPVVRCLVVTYSGSQLPAPVRLYGTTSGALAPYLNLTVEQGTGGTFADCTGFSSSSTVFTGTLTGFGTAHTGWANGAAVFTAAANPTARTVRFTVEVQNNALAQGQSANATFTFETQA